MSGSRFPYVTAILIFTCFFHLQEEFRGKMELLSPLIIVDMIQDQRGSGFYRSLSHQIFGDEAYFKQVRSLCLSALRAELTRQRSPLASQSEDQINLNSTDMDKIEAVASIFNKRVALYDYNSVDQTSEPVPLVLGPSSAQNTLRLSCHTVRSTAYSHLRIPPSESRKMIEYNSVVDPSKPPPLGDTFGPFDSIRILSEA